MGWDEMTGPASVREGWLDGCWLAGGTGSVAVSQLGRTELNSGQRSRGRDDASVGTACVRACSMRVGRGSGHRVRKTRIG